MTESTNQKQPAKYNPYFDPATDNLPIDAKVISEVINDPKADPAGITAEDGLFLSSVMTLVENKTINLYQPSSLLKKAIYDSLSEEIKGKADLNAVILLSTIRQIKELCDLGKKDSFQVKNLIHQARMTKERVEGECGDVYLI